MEKSLNTRKFYPAYKDVNGEIKWGYIDNNGGNSSSWLTFFRKIPITLKE